MNEWVYGKNGQVWFDSEEEKQIAVEYILTSPNCNFWVHENNQEQGAWGPEDRIIFYSAEGIPECLRRIMTAGNGSFYGRINCKEFCEELRRIATEQREHALD